MGTDGEIPKPEAKVCGEEMDGAGGEEADPGVTIGEYLDEVEKREREADLVLGIDEGTECTFDKGYMKRQALFSCLTCTPEGNAGVCTTCSFICHEGHQIVELWTKRNFRCDCGNSKFGKFTCKLFPNKDAENTENSYNHNFKGLYCACDGPYPDPAAKEQLEMIQCCLCEDWFHLEHIGLESAAEVPKDEDGDPAYDEFMCKACSQVCFFVRLYPEDIWSAEKQTDSTDRKGKAVLVDMSPTRPLENPIGESSYNAPKVGEVQATVGSEYSFLGKSVLCQGESSSGIVPNECPKSSTLLEDCVLGVNICDASPVLPNGPMFLSDEWRDVLCRCNNCLEYYNQKNIAFLLDREDSISEYWETAELKREERLQQREDAELRFLNRLGHVEKVEILKGIEEMKDGLSLFLESADPSKPVTVPDIQHFFEELRNKRRRVD